jgi:hypothetical protein
MTTNPPLTPEQAAALFKNLGKLTAAEKMEALELLDKAQEHQQRNLARTDMIEFAKSVYPGFKIGPHHRKLAKIFSEVIAGTKKRVIINIAPRMGKSEFSSYLFPAFFLGNFPQKKIIMGTHTAGLSEDFGRRVRNLLADEDYHALFPQTLVADDQKPVSGLQVLAVSITLLVSAALLLVVVLICSLLTIPTRSRTLRPTHGWLSTLRGLGSRPGRSSD